jgi:hypothetical protein
MKKPRITFSGEVIASATKAGAPSPATYETTERWKKLSHQKKLKGTYT